MAELSTAMPKAGGTYYFLDLDRAMGPLMGTIGGLGSWIAVVFKSAFALVGMGAPCWVYFNDRPRLCLLCWLDESCQRRRRGSKS